MTEGSGTNKFPQKNARNVIIQPGFLKIIKISSII